MSDSPSILITMRDGTTTEIADLHSFGVHNGFLEVNKEDEVLMFAADLVAKVSVTGVSPEDDEIAESAPKEGVTLQ